MNNFFELYTCYHSVMSIILKFTQKLVNIYSTQIKQSPQNESLLAVKQFFEQEL